MKAGTLRPHLFVDLVLIISLGVFLLAILPARAERGDAASASPLALQAPDLPEPQRPVEPPPGELKIGPHSTYLGPRLAGPEDTVYVIVELEDEPAAVVFAREHSRATAYNGSALPQTVAAARAQLARIDRAQTAIGSVLAGPHFGARILSRLGRAYNGLTISVASGRLEEIGALPGVRSVHPALPYYRMLDTSTQFIGAPRVWDPVLTGGAFTGKGVVVAVIDDGIDYTHSNFGGSGDYQTNDRAIIEAGTFPTPKIINGFDFAGDDFDAASSDPALRIPHPDADPLSCNGHGTKVASAIAGYGVNANGTTYTGLYNLNTPFSTLRIGPGVAPEASMIALKIFGCGGATRSDLIAQAIDQSIDPDGDGDFFDSVDIINMSLGSPFFPLSGSPELTSIDNAALVGVVNVVAAGNNGDTYYSVNGLGRTPNAISVAASVDDGVFYQNVQINSPPGIAGQYPAAVAEFGPSLGPSNVNGRVALTLPADGCTPILNITQIAGNIALIDRGTCSFTTKAHNAMNAGATAAIIANNTSTLPLNMGDDGTGRDITIPSFLLSQSASNEIRQELQALNDVDISLLFNNVELRPELANTLLAFSSRGGVFGNIVKPDIAAPGLLINSANFGSSDGAAFFTGTSMAAPHVAGVVALLRQQYPNAVSPDLYARLTSTANPVFSGANNVPPKYGATSAGAGTLQANAAAETDIYIQPTVLVSDTGTFGIVKEIYSTETIPVNLQISNRGNTARDYSVTYDRTSDIPGVDPSFPPTVNVPGNSTTNYQFIWNLNPANMKNTRDPTVAATQGGTVRDWLSEEIGYFLFAPSGGGGNLRVPVYIAARPASNIFTTQSAINLSGSTGSANLALTGQQVFTGSDFANGDIISLLYPFEWQGFDPNDPLTPADLDYLDIQYTGVRTSSSGADQILQFGISTYGDRRSLNESTFNIFIDTDQDGIDDFILYNTSIPNAQGAPSDAFVTRLFDITSATTTTQYYVNLFSPTQRPTYPYNTNIAVLGVRVSDLVLAGDSAFTYTVKSSLGNVLIDQSGPFIFDLANPGLDFGPANVFNDLNGSTVPITYNLSNFNKNASEGVLICHTLNTSGNHVQVLPANLGLEGDLNGDGVISSLDVPLWRLQFENGTNLGNEFQRTDTAPRDTKGDGIFSVTDWTQIGRYSDNRDPSVSTGGPLAPQFSVPPTPSAAAPPRAANISGQARTLRAVAAGFTQGQANMLDIEIDALGGENGVGFSLNFDPAALAFDSAALGDGVAGGSLLAVNSQQLASGRLGLALVLPPGQGFAAGTFRIVRVNFMVVAGSTAPTTQVTFGDAPALREVANVNADPVPTSYAGVQIAIIRVAAHVSAASFSGATLAAESIVAAFGTSLATRTEVADTLPLPTTLAGTTVSIRDSAGVERLAFLFFVSAGQINYVIAAGTAPGMATITITSEDGAVSVGAVLIETVAPGLFAANANGAGVAAAQVLRVKADGTQIFEQVAVFDPATNQFIAAPIDLGPPEDQVFLVLFGTGIRFRSGLPAVQLTVGGTNLETLFAGAQGVFVGLDQLNALLVRSLAGSGSVQIVLTVDGKPANVVNINIR